MQKIQEITDGEHGRTIALMEQKDVEKVIQKNYF